MSKLSLDSKSLYTKSVFINAINNFSKREDIIGKSCIDVHKKFCEWCKTTQFEPPSIKMLGRAIGETYGIKAKPRRVNGKIVKIWDYI